MSGTKCFCKNGAVSHAHFVQVNLVILAQKCIFEPQDSIFRTSRADPSESARDDLSIGAGFERNGPELQKLEAFEESFKLNRRNLRLRVKLLAHVRRDAPYTAGK